MPERVDNLSKISAYVSYTTGVGLVMFDDIVGFMNRNAAAIGASVAVLTYLTNLSFNYLHYRRKQRTQELLLSTIPATYITKKKVAGVHRNESGM